MEMLNADQAAPAKSIIVNVIAGFNITKIQATVKVYTKPMY